MASLSAGASFTVHHAGGFADPVRKLGRRGQWQRNEESNRYFLPWKNDWARFALGREACAASLDGHSTTCTVSSMVNINTTVGYDGGSEDALDFAVADAFTTHDIFFKARANGKYHSLALPSAYTWSNHNC